MRDFPQRLLRKNHATGIPYHVVFLDTETTPRQYAAYERHEFRLGITCAVRYSCEGEPERESWREHQKSLDLCRYLSELVREKVPLYIFAHNVFFDLQTIGFFKHFAQWGWVLRFYYDKGVTYILIVSKGDCCIKCVSTTNFFECSVKALGEMIGLAKQEVDFNVVDKKTLARYCHRDVEIIKLAMERYFTFLVNEDLGRFTASKASQALHAYRHRFMDHRIYLHDCRDVAKLEREGYFGGRVECFQLGKLTDGPFVSLDVNSMYPYVMKKFEMPVRLVNHRNSVTLALLKNILQTFCVVSRVRLQTDVPIYPVRIKRKAIYPIGTFDTVLCTPALIEAIRRNHVVSVGETAIYEKARIFDEYVDFFYALKAQYHREKKEVERYLVKKLLNALYGKWAQKKPVVEEELDITFDGYYRDETLDLVTGKTELEYKMLNKYVRIYGEEDAELSFIAISAHITEAARVTLWNIIESIGVERVLYCDTDSIKIRKDDLCYVHYPISQEGLGDLKIEEVVADLTIYGLKAYLRDGKRVIKGIPAEAIEVHPGVFEYTSWLKQASHMREKVDQGFLTKLTQKRLHGEYDKGTVLSSGRVVPFVLELPPAAAKI